MYQPSCSYASRITQPSWRWSYQHGKRYARWLHHTPINTPKDYHASNFMIILIKHNPTILALVFLNIERAMQDSYITQRSIHKKIIMHQTSWSYASSVTQPSWRWSYKHGKIYARWLHHTPINTGKIIIHQPSWSYASSITQPSWRWSYKHGKSYTRWLHQTPINTRKEYHVSTFMIIRIKHNPTIFALELSTWKELRKMVTSHTDQYTKK